MVVKGIIFEDFVNYKKPAMVIEMPYCNFKCDRESRCQVCQNSKLVSFPNIRIEDQELIARYASNPITEAIVFQGLEPFDSWEELIRFIFEFREEIDDDIVIYTGYNREEIENFLFDLQRFPNIIIKFGRFIPGRSEKFDDILGVELASDNQYGVKIS